MRIIARLTLLEFIGGLGGKRGLSLDMIRRLHDGLGIPAEIPIRATGAAAG